MVMLLRDEHYALLLQIHQKLILFTQNYFCLSVFDSSPFPAWPPSTRHSYQQWTVRTPGHFNRFGMNQEQLENVPFDYPKRLPLPIGT